MNILSEMQVLSTVCRKLEEAKIPYMLTGSFASNFYTVPRMTRDIDIVVELNNIDKEKLIQVFEKEFYISPEAVNDAVKQQNMFNAIHNDTVFKVDFIIRKNVCYRETEFKRRRQVSLNNQLIWIVSPEDLIISKLFWAKDSLSQLQLKDIKSLLNSVPNLDKQYMQTWIQELHLGIIYEQAETNG